MKDHLDLPEIERFFAPSSGVYEVLGAADDRLRRVARTLRTSHGAPELVGAVVGALSRTR